ncbi:putative cysteine-rich receptor-like protein kinase 20 [Glycine soja]|uniref:Putative cysteine-rich receptor-like protein kinase 20 n=1 Tax=Glycine soja TaxID=3848 RepID=A0A445KZR0_GLYSO|nr:putative cysteine-rich receptor-like protein kinase 20 [Glycine soja]
MLLYEYMSNKSLDSFLFDPTQSKLLDWSTRFHIIDLKASNILLDNDMNPKFSDFDLARLCGDDQIEGNRNRACRTWKKGNLIELIDDCLGDSYVISEALRCIQVGLLCIQHHPYDRPNMASVVVMLTNETILAQPKEPGFLLET